MAIIIITIILAAALVMAVVFLSKAKKEAKKYKSIVDSLRPINEVFSFNGGSFYIKQNDRWKYKVLEEQQEEE